MAEPIKITVKGTDVGGQDAPTVEDLVSQIQDLIVVLHGVEEAISENGAKEIVWRVTNVTRNSPISFEITPFPKNHAMNIDRRAEKVVTSTAKGMNLLATGRDRPAYFSEMVIDKVEKVYERVTNGLAATAIDFSNYLDAPTLEIDKSTSRTVVSEIRAHRLPKAAPHKELGSVEGTISRVELDGFGRPIIWLRSRLDGQIIKCVATGGALDRIGHYEVGEVLQGMRVSVNGTIHYKDLELISTVDVEGVHVFPDDTELPDYHDVVSPGFTRGMEACAFLEALRSNG